MDAPVQFQDMPSSPMAPTLQPEPKCTICYGIGNASCSKTHKWSNHYCAKCEALDGAEIDHALCKEYVTFYSSPRPTKRAAVAIFFPVDGKGPEWFWYDGGEKVERDTPNGKAHWIKLLGDEILPEKKDIIIDPKAMEVGLKHPLTARIRAKVFSDGSKPNLSVIEFTQGDQAALWSGPVIVFGQRFAHDPKRFRDITLDDIGYLFKFFNSYHNAPFHDDAALDMDEALSNGKLDNLEKSNPMLFNSIMYKYASDERIKAVEIACKGDQEFMNLEKFRSINIPTNHPLFSVRPTKVTKLMGLPLRIRSVAPDLAWRDKRRTIYLPHHNEIAWWLNMCVDTADRAFGVADPDGDLDIRGGRVQVVRKDGKDISPHQVEALAAFLAAEVAPHAREVDALVSKNCNEAGFDGELRQHMLAKSRQSEVLDFFLNQTYFEACFAGLKRLKIAAGDKSWESEKSPYDTVVDNGDQEDDEEEDEVELGEDEQVEMKLERMCERLEQHDGGCVMC